MKQPQPETAPNPTAGMNMAQRILHVGGRNNAAGYVEFGSIQAVEALVRQVLRDLPKQAEAVPCQMTYTPVWKNGVDNLPYQLSNFGCATCGYVGKHDTHPGCKRKQAEVVPQGKDVWLHETDNGWLAVEEDGTEHHCATEDEACAFQRGYRVAQGMDPMTGAPQPKEPPVCPTCDGVGFCIKPSECAPRIATEMVIKHVASDDTEGGAI